MTRIAHIENDMSDKFGIPRQSGLAWEVTSTIVFEPHFRNPDALKGLEDYSHIWLIWSFDTDKTGEDADWSPMVRPPRLGGNTRMGVFATRSPNRPNPIGLSCVRLLSVEDSDRGPLIHVAGADLRHGTSILDIKPYLPYTDSHPEAKGGFADAHVDDTLEVVFTDELKSGLSEETIKAAVALLKYDPRPSYHDDPERIYGMKYGDHDFRFTVCNGVLTVMEVKPA